VSSGLLKDLVYGWFFGFLVPKSIIYPVFRGMWKSMKATEALDAQDRAEAEGEGGTFVRTHPRRRRPPRGGSPRTARRDRARH
jgi:hypothetical protein